MLALRNPDLKLLLVFWLLSACQLLRVIADPVGFLGTDSYFYLQAAAHLARGHGPLVFPFPNSEVVSQGQLVYLTAFPVGYSLLIAGVVNVTGFSAFWASKLVNLLCLGGCLLVLRKLNPAKAWLAALVLGTCTQLEVFAYTWSEGPFLFLLLAFCWLLFSCMGKKALPFSGWFLWAIGCLLFLVKYIGLFVVPVLVLAGFYFIQKNRKNAAMHMWAAAAGIVLFSLFYFWLNFQKAGMIWGGDRVFIRANSTAWHFLKGFAKAILNELNLLRHYYFRGPADKLFWPSFAIQFAWFGLIWFRYIRGRISLKFYASDSLTGFLWLVAAAYLISLLGLRVLSPFDAFYFRLMAPASLLFYVGLVFWLCKPERLKNAPGLELNLAIFLIFCLLLQLPKAWLISLL